MRELLEVDISKQQQSSDWGADELSPAQLDYAASDVLYLHRLRDGARRAARPRGTQRSSRRPASTSCRQRARLDLAGWAEVDIFAHS